MAHEFGQTILYQSRRWTKASLDSRRSVVSRTECAAVPVSRRRRHRKAEAGAAFPPSRRAPVRHPRARTRGSAPRGSARTCRRRTRAPSRARRRRSPRPSLGDASAAVLEIPDLGDAATAVAVARDQVLPLALEGRPAPAVTAAGPVLVRQLDRAVVR